MAPSVEGYGSIYRGLIGSIYGGLWLHLWRVMAPSVEGYGSIYRGLIGSIYGGLWLHQ